MNQGPRWTLLMKKTRAVKSRATVPLNASRRGFKADLRACLGIISRFLQISLEALRLCGPNVEAQMKNKKLSGFVSVQLHNVKSQNVSVTKCLVIKRS